MEPAPPPLDYASPERKTWRVGTLVYDRAGLTNVFFWMLWGDFCLNLMDSGVQPSVIPLQLNKYGASLSAIGFLTGTVVEIMSIVMVVIVSTWSDRHRGWLGRRMPFMLYATPPLAICLIALGFSPQLAGWLQHVAPHVFGGIAISSLVVGVISVTMIGYKFFDLFPQSVYYYLFADVIPQKVMGTFATLFRACSTAGVLFFNYVLLKHAEDNPGMICVLAAALYVASFVMLCLMVREGEYPPPRPPERGPLLKRGFETIRRYVNDCYSIRYYWKFYAFSFFFICGLQPFSRFVLFYGRQVTHGDLGRLGKRSLRCAGLSCKWPRLLSIGPVIDRLHPIRAGMIGQALMMASAAAGFYCISGPRSFTLLMSITFIAIALGQGSYASLLPRILPREQYGQFCSATSMLWHFGLMVTLPICGKVMDVMGDRYVFAWFAVSSGVGLVLLYVLYLDWKKLGGDENYVPPTAPTNPPRGFEVVTNRV